MSDSAKLLERVRGIVEGWPEVDERLSHGAPTFWGGRKTFCSFADHHHGDEHVCIWVKSTLDMQEGLIAADPVVFFRPPYVGVKGWVGVRLDPDSGSGPDWGQVEDLLEEAYRSVAPQRAIRALDVMRGDG